MPLVKLHSCNKSTNLLPVLARRGGKGNQERQGSEKNGEKKTARENEQANRRAHMPAFRVDTLKPRKKKE